MDYSQYQVKYIDTPISNSYIPDLETEPLHLDNISYLNGEAQSPTYIIEQEEAVKENPVKKVIKKPTIAPKFKVSKGLTQFNRDFDEALKIGGNEAAQLQSRRALLTHIAQVESTFNSNIQNKTGAPAYGYFQFMQGPYKGKNYNNIVKHAKVDTNTFRNSPVLQIRAANSLANEFLASIGKSNLDRLHKLGWTDNAIIAGAWLGGPGGVLKYAFRNIDSSDGSDTVGKRMRLFNY